MMMKSYLLGLIMILLLGLGCQSDQTPVTSEPINWNDEIIYHVVQRSFYDSDGDLHGDLKGFTQKLDYLKELGLFGHLIGLVAIGGIGL